MGPAKVMPSAKGKNMLDDMDKLVSLCKRRGFIFPSSEVYGGINGFWDYGPLGVELKRNIKEAWWRDNVRMRRRHGRPGLLDHHESAGLGSFRACRRLFRPDGRLPGDQGAVSGRSDLTCSPTFFRRSITRGSRPRRGWPAWGLRPEEAAEHPEKKAAKLAKRFGTTRGASGGDSLSSARRRPIAKR